MKMIHHFIHDARKKSSRSEATEKRATIPGCRKNGIEMDLM